MSHSKPSFTVALPVFNEASVLEQLHEQLTVACGQVGLPYEILYVDDGSSDDTPRILNRLAQADIHVTVARLSRNFGHPAALAAALDLASGECLILMDADMQDDPASIPELVRTHKEQGAEVVYVVRGKRSEGLLLRPLFRCFHWFFSRTADYGIPQDAGSFGLLGPRALVEVRLLTERLRYFPGLRAYVGFEQVGIEVARGKRYDKRSRVGFKGLMRLAGLAFFSSSRAPVTAFYMLSAFALLLSLGLMSYAVVAKITGIAVRMWASILTSVAFFSAVILLGQAFICEYLSRVYEEVRGRPVYIVAQVARAQIVQSSDDSN